MVEASWFFRLAGKLYFVYRARNWDAVPVRYLDDTEVTAVSATAIRSDGVTISIVDLPTYSAVHKGYIGAINGDDLEGIAFVTITMTPTVADGVPIGWAQIKILDISIDDVETGIPELKLE